MIHFPKCSCLALSAGAFALAVDAALGLGTAQSLADLYRSATPGTRLPVLAPGPLSPLPLLALSVLLACLGLGLVVTGRRDLALGRTPPDAAEHAGILSAITMTAATTGKTTESDIANMFQIVTGTVLAPELAELAYRRYRTMSPETVDPFSFDPLTTPLARRRVMAAALMAGCVANDATAETSAFIESLAFSIGATSEDVAAARNALNRWSETDANLKGSPLITLLRGKPLGLRPA